MTQFQAKHGMKGSPEYTVWGNMLRRCRTQTSYLKLGIQVCEAWRSDFTAFYKHVGPRPTQNHTIDRINPFGHYEPGNVRWATSQQQNNNRTNNRRVVYRGQKMTLAEAVHAAGDAVPTKAVSKRLNRGWTVERSVETPLSKWGRRHPVALLSTKAGQEWTPPEGWQLVPKAPTETMCAALRSFDGKFIAIRYRAMLAASPPPPAQQQEWRPTSDQIEAGAKQIHHELGTTITAARVAFVKALTAAKLPPPPNPTGREA